MAEPRIYTREEANATLDRLRELLPRLRDARRELIGASQRITEAVAADGGGVAGTEWFRAQSTLKADVEELARLGVILRDPEAGLVDFPAERGGRPILLCWRLGEPDVAWYHDERAGFRGRKAL